MFFAVAALLFISSTIAAPNATTWQTACMVYQRGVKVSLNDSFIYPASGATYPSGLKDDCAIEFYPDPGVAMHIVITGAYNNNSISVHSQDPGHSLTVQTLGRFEIIPSGRPVTVIIHSSLVGDGPLTIEVFGNQVGLYLEPVSVPSRGYQVIYSTEYANRTANPTFAVTTSGNNMLAFFFCFHPSNIYASEGRFIFYSKTNQYIISGANYVSQGIVYNTINSAINVFYDIDPNFIGQVIAYATNTDEVYFGGYSSMSWEGQATITAGSALVLGRQDPYLPGLITITLDNPNSSITIYSGIVQIGYLPKTGIIATINGTSPIAPLVILQPVVTILGYGGNTTVSLSTGSLPSTQMITTTKTIPVTTPSTTTKTVPVTTPSTTTKTVPVTTPSTTTKTVPVTTPSTTTKTVPVTTPSTTTKTMPVTTPSTTTKTVPVTTPTTTTKTVPVTSATTIKSVTSSVTKTTSTTGTFTTTSFNIPVTTSVSSSISVSFMTIAIAMLLLL